MYVCVRNIETMRRMLPQALRERAEDKEREGFEFVFLFICR